LAAALPFAGLTSVVRSVLEARERFLLISIVQAIAGSLTYLVPLALSFGTRDVRVLIAGAALSRICGFTAFMAAARLVWPGEFPWSSVNLRAEREFREFSFWIVISNVIGTAIVYGDRALLVGMFGLTEVAFYNVPLEVVGRMMIIVNSAATVIFPSLARFAGKGMTLERVYVPLMTLLSVVAGAAFLALSIATPACLSLWLGETFQQHSSPVIRILLVGLGFQTLNVMALAMLNAGGMARPITLMHIAETPLYFGSLYLSGEHLGLPGIALVWSGRAVLEYLCFTGLQMRAAMPGSAGLQLTGSVLSAGNFIPLAIMAGSGQLVMAVLAGTVWALVSAFWSLSRLRAAHRQC
jgi:O-antigen/teichoic acid export membrane protein